MSTNVVHVAVGVILGNDGRILIAKRPDKTHQGGLWEFPGGKVEPGETLAAALKRELLEELCIEVLATQPLIKIRHDYGDKVVLLDVHKVTEFTGEPRGNEGQPIAWVTRQSLCDYEFPMANRPIITAINLPRRVLITGDFNSLAELLSRTERALQQGVKLVQLRTLNRGDIEQSIAAIHLLCEQYGAALIVNTSVDHFTAISNPQHKIGLHLNSHNLRQLNQRPVDASILLSCSCHNRDEIERAQNIGVDFIYLSPVLETGSHPEQQGMGWGVFEDLVSIAKVPVYALGGMNESHMSQAIAAGAQGIASISAWWETSL